MCVPGTEKRSQRSKAGSARGVLRTCASFLMSTVGVACFEAGEEMGDELLARFRPLRVSSGDMARGWLESSSLRHRMRSPGERFSSSWGASGLLSKSCHAVRLAGVATVTALSGSEVAAWFEPVLRVSEPGWASNWKACSLVFVFAETGKGRGGMVVVWGWGLLLDRCHCGRWGCQHRPRVWEHFKTRLCTLTLDPLLCSEKDFVRGMAPVELLRPA